MARPARSSRSGSVGSALAFLGADGAVGAKAAAPGALFSLQRRRRLPWSSGGAAAKAARPVRFLRSGGPAARQRRDRRALLVPAARDPLGRDSTRERDRVQLQLATDRPLQIERSLRTPRTAQRRTAKSVSWRRRTAIEPPHAPLCPRFQFRFTGFIHRCCIVGLSCPGRKIIETFITLLSKQVMLEQY